MKKYPAYQWLLVISGELQNKGDYRNAVRYLFKIFHTFEYLLSYDNYFSKRFKDILLSFEMKKKDLKIMKKEMWKMKRIADGYIDQEMDDIFEKFLIIRNTFQLLSYIASKLNLIALANKFCNRNFKYIFEENNHIL